MLGNVVGIIVLILVTVAIAMGVRAAWRTRRPLVRWPVAFVGGLFTAVGLLVSCAAVRGATKVYTKGGRAIAARTVQSTPERIARGQHIASSSCVSCHTLDTQLPLSGGHNLTDEIHIPMGNLTPYNLTPSGPLKDWSDGEIFRAIREGYDRDGTPLMVMSAQHVRYLSDDDLESVVAFLRSQPSVSRDIPPEYVNVLGLALVGLSMTPHIDEPPPVTVASAVRGTTPEYGAYIVKWAGCTECHGPQLGGTKGGFLPPAPSLRVTKGWTTEQFVTTIRTGVDPFGKKLDPVMMPWKAISRFDDDELQAIHAYLMKADIPLKP